MSNFATILFNIWRQRNCKLWDNILQPENHVVHVAGGMLCDWLLAQEEKRRFLTTSCPSIVRVKAWYIR